MKMKKLFLLVVLTTFVSSPLFSQDTDGTAGIRGSFNLTNFYVDNVDDENLKPGFSVGIYYESKLSELISIQPEINYALKGSQITYNNAFFGSGTYRYNFSYVEVPVLANIHLGDALYLSAGPYVGALISVKVKDIDSDGTTNSVTQLDRDDFNTFDYGLAAGAGFKFSGGSFGIRYNYGLAEVDSGDEAVDNGRNSALQFFIGFDF